MVCPNIDKTDPPTHTHTYIYIYIYIHAINRYIYLAMPLLI